MVPVQPDENQDREVGASRGRGPRAPAATRSESSSPMTTVRGQVVAIAGVAPDIGYTTAKCYVPTALVSSVADDHASEVASARISASATQGSDNVCGLGTTIGGSPQSAELSVTASGHQRHGLSPRRDRAAASRERARLRTTVSAG